ncbi:hypothetical protein TraAM80_03342 [Trypanosoma rangeli]|uniref:Uncharacterized protein n=1 Tax=Trypanosoma rangeli TaxID=5698 RepID=A0A422NPF6_TRYRA|nr:uncharacterized protein TraAM80_03342 [Trypanosoma rangeli]RNF07373.1 hypothetical protein TraAM80_03342 [Trypanosoma rangeli]|eukprot:RNF07373.1 hypothetical protein TraAM80_03342 [Trypanosoma rangeli]
MPCYRQYEADLEALEWARGGGGCWPFVTADEEGCLPLLKACNNHLELLATVQRALGAADSLAMLSGAISCSGSEAQGDTASPFSSSGSEDMSASSAYLQAILAAVVTLAESQHIDLENAVRNRVRSLALDDQSLLGHLVAEGLHAPMAAGAEDVDSTPSDRAEHTKHTQPRRAQEGKQRQPSAPYAERSDVTSAKVTVDVTLDDARMSHACDGSDSVPQNHLDNRSAERHSCGGDDFFLDVTVMAAALGVEVAGGPEDVQVTPASNVPPHASGVLLVGAESSYRPASLPCVAGVTAAMASQRADAETQVQCRLEGQYPRPTRTTTAAAADVHSGAAPMPCTAAVGASQASLQPTHAVRNDGVEEAWRISTRHCEAILPTESAHAVTSHCALHVCDQAEDVEEDDEDMAFLSVASVTDGLSAYTATTGTSAMRTAVVSADAPLERGLAVTSGNEGGGVAPISTMAGGSAASETLFGQEAAHSTVARLQETASTGCLVGSLSRLSPKPSAWPPFPRRMQYPSLLPATGWLMHEARPDTIADTAASLSMRLGHIPGAFSPPDNVVTAHVPYDSHQRAELGSLPHARPNLFCGEEAAALSWTLPVSLGSDTAEGHAQKQEDGAADVSHVDSKSSMELTMGVMSLLPVSSTSPLAKKRNLQLQLQQQCEASATSAVTVNVSPFLPCEESTPSFYWGEEAAAPTTTTTVTAMATNAVTCVLCPAVPSALSATEHVGESANPEVAVLRNTAVGEGGAAPVEGDCLCTTSQGVEGVCAVTATTPTQSTRTHAPPSTPLQDGFHATANIATVVSESCRSSISVGVTAEDADIAQPMPSTEAERSEPPHQTSLWAESEQRARPSGVIFPYGLLLLQQLLQER